MYLTRAFLNPTARAVRDDLADAVALHRTVMRAFPDDSGPSARKQHGVLHRLDEDDRRGRFVLFVQQLGAARFHEAASRLLPRISGTTSRLKRPARPRTRRCARSTTSGSASRREIASCSASAPTPRSGSRRFDAATGTRTKNGRRVPVRGDEGRLAWLHRHAERAGFRVEDVRTVELPARSGGGHRDLTFGGAIFEGILAVGDPGTFRHALTDGIGPGKAFGFGLLSIQRAR